MLIHTFPSFACKSVSPAVDLTISVVCIFATTLILWLAIYRLYFSPLARFPGPKLAALTTLYEFYHNGVHRVKFYSKIEELHKKYGPVVRISPHEIHVADVEFFDQLNVSTRNLDKCAKFYNAGPALVNTTGAEEHRQWRGSVRPYYATKSMSCNEIYAYDTILKLKRRLSTAKEDCESVNLSHAFRATCWDIVSHSFLAMESNLLDSANFGQEVHLAYRGFARTIAYVRFLGMFGVILRNTMEWTSRVSRSWLPERLQMWVTLQEDLTFKVEKVIQAVEEGEDGRYNHGILHKTLSSQLDARFKTREIMSFETIGVFLAGTEATSNVLVTLVYHLITNPMILSQLQGELRGAIPDEDYLPSLPELKRLPYLTAVIKEALRFQDGGTFRLPRICQNSDLAFMDWIIPKGATVSTTPSSLHRNETIFPNAVSFCPERWFEPDAHQKDKYLVPFGKGMRGCLGQDFARSIIYFATVALFRSFSLQLRVDPYPAVNDRTWAAKDGFLEFFPPYESKGLVVEIGKLESDL